MSRPNPVNKHDHRPAGGLEKLGSFLADAHPDLIISKRRMRKVESIECVRLKRDVARQNLGFSSRPFVLCGLPVRMPAPGSLLHERRNGQFVLQVTGHPSYGLPWGQDRLVPIFLATLTIRQQTPRISYRCFTARGKERVPLFGDFGLVSQLGSTDYARPRKFREKLEGWLDLVRTMWPECPASIDADGTGLFIDRAQAVLPLEVSNARN